MTWHFVLWHFVLNLPQGGSGWSGPGVCRRRIDGIQRCCQSVGMTRTQIQLPDDTFARAKKICEAREISLAELARRGIEYILSVYAQEPAAKQAWTLPKPRRLGWQGLSDAEIKEQAQWSREKFALD